MVWCLGLIALSLASVAAHGAGVWTDPKHALGDGSLAGLRFVAESPPHVLTLVSTDNGVDWYTLHGSCSGVGMTTITIDFAPKGGPSEPLSGTWGSTEAGGATITWPDGNVWSMAVAPTAAWQRPTPLDDHQGLFADASLRTDGFAGTRILAEFPPHQLTVVGSDDGVAWWSARGNCSGPHMRNILIDFDVLRQPMGGARDLHGKWISAAAHGSTATIAWDNGATWSKNPTADESKLADDLPAHLSASQLPGYGVAVALLVLVAAAIAVAFVAGRRASGGSRGLLSGGRGSRSEEPPDDGL